jgi:hypothetical protein
VNNAITELCERLGGSEDGATISVVQPLQLAISTVSCVQIICDTFRPSRVTNYVRVMLVWWSI